MAESTDSRQAPALPPQGETLPPKGMRRILHYALLRDVPALYKTPFFFRWVRQCPVCLGQPKGCVFTNSCTELDECGSCGHVYTRRAPKGRILHLRYGSFNYWYEDKLHQGINTLQDRSQWQGFITARRGALERAGLLEKPAQRVFEIGCSEGMLLRALADDGHSVRGCEYNPEIAAAGRKQLGVDILAQGFQTVNEKPGSYDLIVSFHTIEHVDGLQAVFGKAVNMLNAEGAMLIEVPTGPEEYHNIDHLHFFTKQSLERLLKRFFHEVEIFDNSFTTAEGKVVGSLYGSGRFPRTEAGKTAAGTTTAAGGSCCSR